MFQNQATLKGPAFIPGSLETSSPSTLHSGGLSGLRILFILIPCLFLIAAALESAPLVDSAAQALLSPPCVVRAVAFSPDGALLAAGSDDGDVILWDMASGAELAVLEGQAGPVRGLVFTKDGKELVSASGDRPREVGGLTVWDVSRQQLKATLPWSGGAISALGISGDGCLLAAGGSDGAVRFWRVGDWSEQTAYRPHTRPVLALAFQPGTHYLASAAEDECIKLWNAEGGEVSCKFDAPEGGIIFALAFAPDGGSLVSTHGSDQTLRVWDIDSRKLKRCCRDTLGHVRGVAFSPDGTLLATAAGLWAEPGDVGLQPMKTTGQRIALRGHSNVAYCVAFAPSGRFLATGGGDETVRLWDVATRSEMRTLIR